MAEMSTFANMARLMDPKPRFKYVPSHLTDIRKTFERARKRMEREKEKSNVSPLPKIVRVDRLVLAPELQTGRARTRPATTACICHAAGSASSSSTLPL